MTPAIASAGTIGHIPGSCEDGDCIIINQTNVGSLTLTGGSLYLDSTGHTVSNGFGYNVFPPDNQIAARKRLAGGINDADLFGLVYQFESGGSNDQVGGKTQGSALDIYAPVGASGEFYAVREDVRHSGDGDTIGFQAKIASTGTTSASGDEGLIAFRADARDYMTVTIGTAVTFSNGATAPVVVPVGISEFEWDNIGKGNLLISRVGQLTGNNITSYVAGTRTWIYDGTNRGSALAGMCMAETSHDYTDEASATQHVWIPIDTAGANTFTTSIRQVNGVVVGAGQHYVTGGGQSEPVIFATCERIYDLNRDPNSDGNYADGTLTLVGSAWPSNVLDNSASNPTVGSCAACAFEIQGDIIGKGKAGTFITTMRRDTLEENYGVRISAGSGGIQSADALHIHNGSGHTYGWDHGTHCDRSVQDGCLYDETVNNDAANTETIRVDIVQDGGGTHGFHPFVKLNENVSGGLGARSSANLNFDVSGSAEKFTLGASSSVDRPFVTAPHTACTANQVLAYDNSGDLNRGWVCATNAAMIGAPVVNIAGFQVPIPWTYAVTGVASTLATLWIQGIWSRRA